MRRYILGLSTVLLLGAGFVLFSYHRNSVHPAVIVPTKGYIAMGDSVAAGVGLNDDSDSSACDRTNESYPYVLAERGTYKLSNLACSGATLAAGILGSQTVNQLVSVPQIEQLRKLERPELITVTVGANDIGWTNLIAKCYTAICGTDADSIAVQTPIKAVATDIRVMLSHIQTSYGKSTPHVVVTGYHQVFPVGAATCSDLTGIDAAERSWGRQIQTDLNAAISNAVTGYSFSSFAPITFDGHELCSAEPWVQGLADKQPYHPTKAGQAAYASQLFQAIKSKGYL